MTPEEFDINFDFDKEYGADSNPNKSSFDDDFDLDAALERELGPDFDRLFEEEFAAAQEKLNQELQAAQEAAAAAEKDEVQVAEEEISEEEFPEEETADEDDTFDLADYEPNVEDLAVDTEDLSAVFAAVTAVREEQAQEEQSREEQAREEQAWEELPFQNPPVRREKKSTDLASMVKKIDLKTIGAGCAAAGAALIHNFRLCGAALKEFRPGKMDRKAMRRFKNDALPVLIGCCAFLVCVLFIIGSVTQKGSSEERQQAALEASIAQAEAEAAAAAEIQNILNTAAGQAAGYDYQAAIDTLDSYKTEERDLTPEMIIARNQYTEGVNSLVVWDDPTAIPNLSFHALIADPIRAYASDLASAYKSNFVTTDQFSAILEQLYANGYVLVNLDSCLTAAGAEGRTVQPIYLPEGKKPIMITETLVNYFSYMVDSDNDGAPDAGGAGFANRLVVRSGRVVAEYVDAQGNELVGDYDLVPILDSFIETHPDFSYRGARAILAVTGEEGVFGWRTNNGDAATSSDAKKVVEALRASGYQIASNTYGNLDYGSTSMDQISADLNSWKTNVVPVLGDVDILVVARGGALDHDSTRFEKIVEAGFHCVLDAGTAGGKVDAGYFHQNRIMVVGSELQNNAYSTYFTLVS